jgi:glycosyltransferase involved in cell wall biosynthesis
MRLVMHDYGGYAFIVELSRVLANRGHEVLHLHAAFNPTPKGTLQELDTDPAGLTIRGVQLDRPFRKYNFVQRFFQEREYGRRLADEVSAYKPDLVLSANAPLDSQVALQNACRRHSIPFIYWVQDLIGVAMTRILSDQYGPIGSLIAWRYMQLERRMLRRSEVVVLSHELFIPWMRKWNVDPDKLKVIPNWAPLGSLPPTVKDNSWARRHDLQDKFTFLYSGTLGLKHDPERLFDLARYYENESEVRIVVVSQGPGAEKLQIMKNEAAQTNLKLIPFQPMRDYSLVLGSADVLIGLLNEDAGEYSVPSKILSYFCAQRPLLLAMPPQNPAAQLVQSSRAGLVVAPDDKPGFFEAAERLRNDIGLRSTMGKNARIHAEQAFDMQRIADTFENVLQTDIKRPDKQDLGTMDAVHGKTRDE